MADPDAPPAAPTPEGPSKLDRAADAARFVLRHRELLVAALEALRAQQAVSEEDQVKILSAYEQGSTVARAAINELVEKLQSAKFGKVLIGLREVPAALASAAAQGPGGEPQAVRESLAPAFNQAKEQVAAEVRPYLEMAKQRLKELKALEEPTLRRLEAVGAQLAGAGKEVAQGLRGAGREAADELVRRGRSWFMTAETEELEREVFDWALKTLPRAERAFVRVLVGAGLLFLITGVLVAAHQLAILKEITLFVGIFLLVFLGIVFVNWGIKLSEAVKSGRGEIERLAVMTPGERRAYLLRRWSERVRSEGGPAIRIPDIEEFIASAPEGPDQDAQGTQPPSSSPGPAQLGPFNPPAASAPASADDPSVPPSASRFSERVRAGQGPPS